MTVTDLTGEYRVRRHPEQPGLLAVSWRPDDGTAVWTLIATVTNCADASSAMAAHQREKAQ